MTLKAVDEQTACEGIASKGSGESAISDVQRVGETDLHIKSGGRPEKEGEIPEPVFSIFSLGEKWAIIALASVAGLFSTFTANSYFPAIQAIADAFHTSVERINITVTIYMVFQGISPMLWGTLSDRFGRRPLFIICLALLSVSCVGIALTPTNAYWLLLVLRCFQAMGSASTIALGSGTISDIAKPSERGGFLGLFNLAPLLGPCAGPIIGGLLAGSLGWRSIFWFLTISSAVYCIIFFFIFPETLRALVGDGSIPPQRWNRPAIPILTHYTTPTDLTLPPPRKFANPFLQFAHPSVLLLLIFNGTVYSVFYGVTATLSDLFQHAYPNLTVSEIGVCFVAVGMGSGIGSYTNGKLLDADFRRIKRNLERKAVEDGQEKEVKDFPFEYARLRTVPLYLVVYVVALIGYGWSMQRKVHISCSLILQFIIGLMLSSIMNVSQTLLLDLFPTQGSSITAANNLIRCTMGAILVSIIDFILKAIGPGWTYTLLALICVVMFPMNWAVVKYGPKWRAKRQHP
ncbi:major facilitator superfamily domain-containing protein [Hysterangium stoloniferum]|nr:major facilitator superfamily domain-containing protein [Hysterangium stoloniferum]